MRPRIEPMKKVARSLRKHRVLLVNWVHALGGFRTFKPPEVPFFIQLEIYRSQS